jgi:uncharacterized protein
MDSYIELQSGKKFYFLKPELKDFDVEDIAHALAMNCRYTGHCSRFYSVAEHSWHMSRMAPEGLELAALLHDASEAYITDIASPIKQHLMDYVELENFLMGRIAERYKFDYPLNPIIKQLELTMLSTEAHYLMRSKGNDWDLWAERKRPPIQHNFKPIGMAPHIAKEVFLDRYYELQKQQYGTN